MGNLMQKTKRNISIYPERHQDKICIECDESYVYVKPFFEPPPTSHHKFIEHGINKYDVNLCRL